MGPKIFLDANILLDYTLKREFYQEAKDVLQLVIDNKAEAFITSSVLHIAGYWLSKALGSEKAKELLLSLLADITVIDIKHEGALIALHSKINDIEDALQYYTAIYHKLNYFISRDKQLKKDSINILPVLTPFEYIAEIAQN